MGELGSKPIARDVLMARIALPPMGQETNMAMGRVKWFDAKRRFGFLVADDGGEVFFHETEVSAIDNPLGPGDRVIFQTEEGPKGPVARRVFCVWRAHEVGVSNVAG